MKAAPSWKESLEADFRPLASSESSGEEFTVYRSIDGKQYALYRSGYGESVHWCRTISELLAQLRAHVPSGALAEMSGKLMAMLLKPA